MDNKLLAAAVFGAAATAGAVTLGLMEPPAMTTEAPGKEQCYGVAKAGENGCAALNGSHTCGGLSTVDNSGQEWTLVDSGTCLKVGGKLEAFDDPKPAAPAAKEGT